MKTELKLLKQLYSIQEDIIGGYEIMMGTYERICEQKDDQINYLINFYTDWRKVE